MRIVHKLIAIVLIPLTFELVLAGTLFIMVADVERQAAEEHRKRLVSSTLVDLYQRITDSALAVATGGGADELARQQKSVDRDLGDLRVLLGDDQAVDKLANGMAASFALIHEAQTGGKIAALTHLGTTIPAVKKQLIGLKAHIDKEAEEDVQSQQKRRADIVLLLQFGIVCNALMALGLALFIHRNITSRLRVVVENTHRVATARQLLPAVGGTDEITHLDFTFKEMAAALALAEENRKRLERMKQDFVSMISHDLRTPLTSIQIFLNLLTKGMLGDVSDKVRSKAAMADRNATRLISLVNDLLDIDKIESGELSVCPEDESTIDIVERAVDAVRGFAEKQGVSITTAVAADSRCYADSDRIVQVLVNLIGNAVKFSPAGSSITISSEELDDFVMVRVSDQGRGIPLEMQATIFERFKQVEATDDKKGTGLGLSICRAIVLKHGGAVGVESMPGTGSTFWFTIPTVSKLVRA